MATAWRTPAFPISVACNRASSMKWRSLRIPIKVSFSSLSSSSSTNGDGEPQMKQLVLYTKQGCCLCEGLKEKLDVAFSLSGTHSLHNVRLLTRDIATNSDWEKLYRYEIPVLARVLPDGTEETLPRLSPRLGVEIIQKKIASIFKD
ncbi:Glutaredoxin 2 [Zostera marina]|uniref:Glutaredoxin-like protein n=1 Tax=Zostera marina TaxID=29655 RepID=A0A0K9Q5E6_ZOSMR|nr:Glutaredoxin 2 [Zostera marina]